jgi:transcriptional regulator with XRE-family HTH domain
LQNVSKMSLAVAYAAPSYVCGMPTKPRDKATPRDQMTAMGAAIRELRKMAGPLGVKISTTEAGRRAGVTRQTWENYENAKGPVILRQDVQDQIAQALGVTREDLLMQYRRQLGDEGLGEVVGLEEAGPRTAWPVPAGGAVRQVIMPDDTLRPWASSGMTIVYDRNMWPAPDVGVVLERNDGEKAVKIFGHADAEAYHCYELYPARREISFPRADFRAFRVVARLG